MEGTSDVSDGSGTDAEPRPQPFPTGRAVEPEASAFTSGRLRPGFGLTASASNHFNATAGAAWGVRVTPVRSCRVKMEDGEERSKAFARHQKALKSHSG